jgi:hypothetical protein
VNDRLGDKSTVMRMVPGIKFCDMPVVSAGGRDHDIPVCFFALDIHRFRGCMASPRARLEGGVCGLGYLGCRRDSGRCVWFLLGKLSAIYFPT